MFMLTGMRKSVQTELAEFFGHLQQQAQLARQMSAQAFAQARSKLANTTIPELNDWLIEQAQQRGYLQRWQGFRPVAADASTVRFGLRASHVKRAALADQRVFGLFLPGAELMLSASLYSTDVGERQMLFEQLDRLGKDDLLLLDRGYPMLLDAGRIEPAPHCFLHACRAGAWWWISLRQSVSEVGAAGTDRHAARAGSARCARL